MYVLKTGENEGRDRDARYRTVARYRASSYQLACSVSWRDREGVQVKVTLISSRASNDRAAICESPAMAMIYERDLHLGVDLFKMHPIISHRVIRVGWYRRCSNYFSSSSTGLSLNQPV